MSSSLKNTSQKGINFITNTRKSMKSKIMKLWDRLMFRKRLLITP
ncbi:transposase [Candidatus Enterovibrio escicola]